MNELSDIDSKGFYDILRVVQVQDHLKYSLIDSRNSKNFRHELCKIRQRLRFFVTEFSLAENFIAKCSIKNIRAYTCMPIILPPIMFRQTLTRNIFVNVDSISSANLRNRGKLNAIRSDTEIIMSRYGAINTHCITCRCLRRQPKTLL